MAVDTLLLELGAEELPPTALDALSDAFAAGIEKGLQEAEIPFQAVTAYATPRRLAVQVTGLADKQPDREVERRGPALAAAFKDGAPTKAAEGFARSCGVSVDDLIHLETDKGTWLGYREQQQGDSVQALLPEMVRKTLQSLPVPKNMRWGASRVEFSRPVHWLVALYGNEVITAEALGLQASRTTYGHRFHAPDAIQLEHADDYLAALENAYVLADRQRRRERIREQVLAEAEVQEANAVIDEDLLVEVSGLVEWPVALTGSFDERFLEVPAECLISSMKANQKYFHLLDDRGKLKPLFITISNIESQDPDQVISGNEKVIRPRLADAAFFYDTDRKHTLASRIPQLESVVFQQQLGTLADKARRSTAIATFIAERIQGDVAHAQRTVALAKCDLVTEMVLEFPELQGIMGRYYAEQDGEPAEVAQALEEQYLPRFASDAIPQSLTGQALALADRLDTLVGIFGIGQRPTGAKDPFALRRASIGVLNILVKGELNLDLRELLQVAADQHQNLPKADGLVEDVLTYMLDRFRAWGQEEGISAEMYLAVRARPVTKPLDFARRLRAVKAFAQREEAAALAAANKRVSNILSKQEHDGSTQVEASLLQEAAEKALFEAVTASQQQVAPLFAAGDYQQALDALATLREPVDAFFDQVMVMADDDAIRRNRLALLASLQALFLEVADISQLPQ
ncbi:glycine--tRNA ligase beta subunit [Vreelandella aquamarina]|uniref:Glycine--tRNA ligase beta subunit n=1 Tax=Vreelandella aquamarina TaxID=77097 RepID=A0A1N6D344_9GAMM|nr:MULTISPECIES: glycine--tRNA ligase subunit beta [Halomonas]SEN61105.1 glycyl-tRNA synthetase beta chain [Halomonas aquamarina]SIN65104.1 glycyl-tRNA synthetase beta chain [Halomonas meridiana]SIN76064.1 glycyl-tRNA synthetase beta chain [Halomonas meridiana]SIO37793.1 glycyl-tRNA synthetase beta chain [Halomonas meridiana]GED45801.1 glycine--tRNA ligase beta subunit [Halomonas meridiana]